jgi:hypothetical protein
MGVVEVKFPGVASNATKTEFDSVRPGGLLASAPPSVGLAFRKFRH